MNNNKRWIPREGQYRAVGKGPIGFHMGKPVYELNAAEDRKKNLVDHCSETWIERYIEGQWKRI